MIDQEPAQTLNTGDYGRVQWLEQQRVLTKIETRGVIVMTQHVRG